MLSILYRDVLHISISNKFDVDLFVTFVTFHTKVKLTYIVNAITLYGMPVTFRTLQ